MAAERPGTMGGEKLDTRKPTSQLMLTILAGVATWEREIMLERRARASPRRRAKAATRAVRRASTGPMSGSC
jgi:DNA invertase Pin-like site-specific DNA recombinase